MKRIISICGSDGRMLRSRDRYPLATLDYIDRQHVHGTNDKKDSFMTDISHVEYINDKFVMGRLIHNTRAYYRISWDCFLRDQTIPITLKYSSTLFLLLLI
jgi:hypothetical protein